MPLPPWGARRTALLWLVLLALAVGPIQLIGPPGEGAAEISYSQSTSELESGLGGGAPRWARNPREFRHPVPAGDRREEE